VSTSHQSRLVSTVMLDSMCHVHSDTLAVGSGIESNSFVICPHGVAIDSIEFQSFSVVARDLEAAHVHRLTAEGVQLLASLVSHANQLLLGLGNLLETLKFPTWFVKKSIVTCTDSNRDWVINPKT